MTWFQENGTIGDPPDDCELCGKPLEKYAVDGKTRSGIWCWMCLHCHRYLGIGTGLGKGQVYKKATKIWE